MEIYHYLYLTYRVIKEEIEKRKQKKSQNYVSYSPPKIKDESKDNLTKELWNDASSTIEDIRYKDIRDGFIEIK